MRVDIQRAAQYKAEWQDYKQKAENEAAKLKECHKDIESAMNIYQGVVDRSMKDLDASIEEERKKRQEELDITFEESKKKLDLQVERYKSDCEKMISQITDMTEHSREENFNMIQHYEDEIEACRQKYEAILAPLQMYEKEQQEKLYYTIQLPEEFRDDIDYLLTVTSTKVQHPDIISKLVWTTYVKPYLDDLCRRADIRDEAGIYKITHIDSGKSYIGKSTNVKKRIQDHMKSTVGISSIADQVVHHEILKTGFWNWTFEVITYCDKEQLSELEKYYIEFFKSQEYGFNRREGG